MDHSAVNIDKSYFDTLMRRAQVHVDDFEDLTPLDHLPTVIIGKAEYENLLKASREYAILRQNLINGGIDLASLEMLVADPPAEADLDGGSNAAIYAENTPQDHTPVTKYHGNNNYPLQPVHNRYPRQYGNNGQNAYQNFEGNGQATYGNFGWAQDDGNGDDTVLQGTAPVFIPNEMTGFETDAPQNGFQPQLQLFPKHARRTVQFFNLPVGVTHADVVDVVRGGMLLDIYLRPQDRAATVSFLEGDAASAFFTWAKRNDVYLRTKRVGVRWNDRQFILPGHVANKISQGASRNLVIYGVKPQVTEESLRDDLEHIHNLVVIKVTFKDGNAHIETNSVHNALFARTCMMSRATYKNCKIEWYADECAAPLPERAGRAPPKKNNKKALVPVTNRFGLLRMDGTEDSSEDVTASYIADADGADGFFTTTTGLTP